MKTTKLFIVKMNALAVLGFLALMLSTNYSSAQDRCKYVFDHCPGGDISLTSCDEQVITYVAYATHLKGADHLISYSYVLSGSTNASGSGNGSGSTFQPGTTTVTVTASITDCPPLTCTFSVFINCPPQPEHKDTCPFFRHCNNANESGTTTECSTSMQVFYTGDHSASGIMSDVTYAFSGATSGSGSGDGDGQIFEEGTTTVTLTAKPKFNKNCQAGTCTFTVTVTKGGCPPPEPNPCLTDVIEPTAICKSIEVQLDEHGAASIVAADVDDGSNDDCGIKSISIDKSAFDCSNLGDNTVTLTVTDNNDNTSTCEATVTVKDAMAPTAGCVGTYSVTLSGGTATLDPVNLNNGSTDNCGVASYSASKTSFNCSEIGDHTVTLTVKDATGNSSSCDVLVTVIGVVPSVEITQANTDFCTNGNIQLTANASGGDPFSYLWSNALTTQSIDVNSSATYGVTATNTYGCTATDELVLNYTNPSALSAYTIIATDKVDLDDKSHVQSGGVGVFGCEGEIDVEGYSKITGTGTFAKAKDIDVESGSSVTTKYYTAIDVNMPNFKYNPFCDEDEDNCKSKYHNKCGSECKSSKHSHCKSGCKEKNHSKRCHSKYHKKCNSGCKNKNHNHCKSSCKKDEHNHCQQSNCDEEDHHHCSGKCHSNYHKNCNSHCKNKKHHHCKSNCNYSSHNHCSHSNCEDKNDVTVGSNKSVTLPDSIYGKISIGKNSCVTFTSPVIYLKELKTYDDVTIKFTETCVEMMVCEGVELKDDNSFNPAGKSVLMYVEKDFKANDNSTINSSIYSLNDIKVEGSCNNVTKMKGLFVAEKVYSEYAYWNKNTECSSCEQFHKRSEPISSTLEPGVVFNVYPNPSKGIFGVDIATSEEGSYKITVIDLMGREVFTEIQAFSGSVNVPVNLTGSTEGQYIIRAEVNGQVFIKRVMLVK